MSTSGSPAGVSGPVTWSVGPQTSTVSLDATGKAVQGWNIPFTLSTGETSSVFVPLSEYNVANVQGAIQAQVDVLAQVANLSGTANL